MDCNREHLRQVALTQRTSLKLCMIDDSLNMQSSDYAKIMFGAKVQEVLRDLANEKTDPKEREAFLKTAEFCTMVSRLIIEYSYAFSAYKI